MKQILFIMLLFSMSISSCKCRRDETSSHRIPVDSANKMIGSYLNSIEGTGDNTLHSLIFNAEELRAYLNDPLRSDVTNIKLSFAHTLNYINSGNGNQDAGYTAGAFTIVISGYDEEGNYILMNDNCVLDFGVACPSNCPPSGSANNDLIRESR
jgi:hypothetical protein